MPPSPTRTPRKALHERSDSETNVLAKVRLVPYTPPRLPRDHEDLYSRTALPTLPSHILLPTTSATYKGPVSELGPSGSSDNPAYTFPTRLQVASGSGGTISHEYRADQSRRSTGTSTKSRPLSKKRKHVSLNPDKKTFKVLDVDQDDNYQTEDRLKNVSSPASPSNDRSPRSPGIDLSARSPASSVTESVASLSSNALSPVSSSPLVADYVSQSPWNYQFVGGLRKVPKTPDLKGKAALTSGSPVSALPLTLEDAKQVPSLTAKSSFQSAVTASTTSETSNYKLYGGSLTPIKSALPSLSSSESDQHVNGPRPADALDKQSVDSAPPSSSGSNYQILGYSSEGSSDNETPLETYHVEGAAAIHSPYANVPSISGPGYSRESLVVPPLQPRVRRSTDQFGYYKSQSKESLRTGSLTSISTVLSQEASHASVTNGSLIQLPPTNALTASTSWTPLTALIPTRSFMQAHPHQWSSQLSTVPSESETGTETGSRSWSDGNGRRSSGFAASPSFQVLSLGSSLRLDDGHSRTNSLEPPQPIHSRSSPRLVQGLDEYGDGITDMHELRSRPSRTRLSDFISITSDIARTSTMRSNASSRTNSLLSNSIPTWAKLYYGSGERRYLATPGSSHGGSDSRPQSSWRSGSPDTSNFPLNIYSPRKRPRQILPGTVRPSSHQRDSMEISPLPEPGYDAALTQNNSFRRRYRPSSSILSPHLKRDKRASRGSNFFLEPASVDWSSNGDIFSSRRKWLIIMFIAGFIFPFAWIIGALIPLPTKPGVVTDEKDLGATIPNVSKEMASEFSPAYDAQYESANWWKNLNCGMAVLAVLIVAAIIALLVIGSKQGWAR